MKFKVKRMALSRTYGVFVGGRLIEGGFFSENAAYGAALALEKEAREAAELHASQLAWIEAGGSIGKDES